MHGFETKTHRTPRLDFTRGLAKFVFAAVCRYHDVHTHRSAAQGSPCGLGKHSRSSNSHQTSARKHQGVTTTQSFIVTIYSPPTPGARPRRVTRRLKRISYAEPKLNTKLRQVRALARIRVIEWPRNRIHVRVLTSRL
jgi:hypothetical protein